MNLKRLVEISPIIGAFLVFLGFFKLSHYYDHWGISIANYLDFSEILLSFLNDLNIVIFFTVLLVIQFTLGMSLVVVIDSTLATPSIAPNPTTAVITTTQESKPETNENSTFKGILPEIEEQFENHPLALLIVILLFSIVFGGLFLWYKKLVWLYFAFAAVIQLVMYFLDKILGITNEKAVIQISTIATLFFFTYCLVVYDVNQTETKPTSITVITEANDTLTTNKNFLFVGKTNNFYFFYDKLKKQSMTLSSGEVQKVVKSNDQ